MNHYFSCFPETTNSEFIGRWLWHCWLFTTPKKIRYMKSPTKIASGPQCQIPPSNHPWKQAASYDFGKSSSRWIDFFPLTYSSRAYQISLRHFPRPSMFPRGWRYKLCWMIGTPHHYLPQQLRHGSALGSNPPSWKLGVSHNFQAQNPVNDLYIPEIMAKSEQHSNRLVFQDTHSSLNRSFLTGYPLVMSK